jgi:hypothetical protein
MGAYTLDMCLIDDAVPMRKVERFVAFPIKGIVINYYTLWLEGGVVYPGEGQV